MGAMLIPKQGTPGGPCKEKDCGHRDCRMSWNMVLTVCRLCNKLVGFDTWMYADDVTEGGYVHALCLEFVTQMRIGDRVEIHRGLAKGRFGHITDIRTGWQDSTGKLSHDHSYVTVFTEDEKSTTVLLLRDLIPAEEESHAD